MATNSSEHLGLHLWEPGDQVLRTEFNQNWSKIDEAVNTAQETAETPQCKAGTYTGNGKTAEEGGVFVELGFRPKFVIISRARTTPSNTSTDITVGEGTVDGASRYVTFLDNGFQVNYMDTFDGYTALKVNTAGLAYSYVAFR